MHARVLHFFVFFTTISQLMCVTVTKYNGPDIISKSKIELKPLHISATIGDIIIISAPIINSNTLYFLNKPDGDTLQLHLNISRAAFYKKSLNNEYDNIVISFREGKVKSVISAINKYKVFNVNYGRNCFDTADTFKEKEDSMMPNDFMIGPLIEEDHGNWVLSAYYRGIDGNWIEVYQIITVEIIESVQTLPAKPKVELGKDLELRLAFPIKDLQSCEIVAPRSTFDRFYDRDNNFTQSCGFRMPNVTREDEGTWRIIGVGNIVYEANVYVEINPKL